MSRDRWWRAESIRSTDEENAHVDDHGPHSPRWEMYSDANSPLLAVQPVNRDHLIVRKKRRKKYEADSTSESRSVA